MIGIDEALYKVCEDNRKLEDEIEEKDKEIDEYHIDKEDGVRLLNYITNLQEENEDLKDNLETMTFTAKVKQEAVDSLISRVDKAATILKDTNVHMPQTLLIETIDYARHILNGSDE